MIGRTVNGRLYAFYSDTLGAPLWSTDIINYMKFVPPTISNGKVYVATANCEILVFGLRANPGEMTPQGNFDASCQHARGWAQDRSTSEERQEET